MTHTCTRRRRLRAEYCAAAIIADSLDMRQMLMRVCQDCAYCFAERADEFKSAVRPSLHFLRFVFFCRRPNFSTAGHKLPL